MNKRRGDRAAHLQELGLDVNECDEVAELLASGGRSHTDRFETFPGIEPDATGRFHTRVTLHGLRHVTSMESRRCKGCASATNCGWLPS